MRLSWKLYNPISASLSILCGPKTDVLTHLQDLRVRKVPVQDGRITISARPIVSQASLSDRQCPYFCANQALVTTLSFSLTALKACGVSVMSTTAFCTVLLVTSFGRLMSWVASSCRVQLMPKRDLDVVVEDCFWTRVKYEKSSTDLETRDMSE